MIIFIDDSGDPGFKIDKGASEYFVIACVIFPDDLEAEKTAVAIKELKRELGFNDNIEFKFNKSSKKVRLSFLTKITKFNFKIRALVMDKSIIRSQELRNNKNSFYSYAIKSVLEHNGGNILNAKIKIDGSGDRKFRKSFLTYLRKQLNMGNRKIMEQCRLVDSKTNVLIQMADMVVGSIKRSYTVGKTDSQIYKIMIKSKIQDEWNFK